MERRRLQFSMSSPLAPMVALGAVSYANNWYNTKDATDVKPLLFAGVAGLLLAGIGAIPGAEPVATLLGWTAFVGFLITPVQNPSPATNLLKITGKG
jgi:hypothetical protein